MSATVIPTSTPHPSDCLCSICGTPESLRLKRGPLRVEAIAADSIFNQAYGAGAKAIMDGKRRLVAIVLGPEALSVPDAELIVRAVNNHDSLIEAIEALLADYKKGADSGDWGFWDFEAVPAVIQARAAIAKAKGESA